MNPEELDDFFLEGGDELVNSEPCPKCGEPIYLDQAIEWVDEEKRHLHLPSLRREGKD